MNDVEQRISQIIVRHFGIEEDRITPAADFRSDMSADSLDLIDLTLSVEDAFGIEIAEEAAERLHTVGDLIAFIRIRQAGLRVA
jgi:acyl carrier protein